MTSLGTADPERFHRRLIRYLVAGAAAVFSSGVALSLVQSNVQEWAKANGQDQYLVRYAAPAISWLADVVQTPNFLAIAWFVIGGASILWIDYAIRRRTKQMAIALFLAAGALIAIAIWILMNPVVGKEESKYHLSDADRTAIIAPYQSQIDALRSQLASIAQPSSHQPYWLEKKAGQATKRPFTSLSVRQLRALYEGRTRLQADAFMADEKGKLLDVTGTVQNVDSGMAMLLVNSEPNGGMPDYVECRFESSWNGKLGTFRQSDQMKIRGTISQSQNGAQIYLDNCEIVGP